MEQSKCCTKCHTVRPLASFSKKGNGRIRSSCKQCENARSAKWRAANPEKERARGAKWYQENLEKVRERIAKWRAANPEKERARGAKWRRENLEKVRERIAKWQRENPEKRRASNAKWVKNNIAKVNTKTAKRRAQRLRATPPWLCGLHLKQIQQFYTEAARLTKETGVKYHVDHIIPLQGREVRGLHVPWNLQVIPAVENLSKGNRITA